MDLSEFEQDRKLDPSQLDVEAVQQADLFFKWAERAITARSDAERLELVLEVTEARIQAEIRKDPESFKLEGRVTEAGVAAAVKQSARYIEAHDAWLDAKEQASLLDKAVIAMDMKKRMIESLITLHGQQYFAGPSTPRNLVAAWTAHQEKMGTSARQRQLGMTRKRGEGQSK